MNNKKIAVAVASLLVASASGIAGAVLAQAPAGDNSASPSAFPDVPQNHWAYEAIQDLANKGLIKGYPSGTFIGNRSLSRYEFATVIDRILQTLEDIKAAPEPAAAAPQVTEDDLNKIQVLVDTFQTQLNAIQDNVTSAQNDIESLRQDVLDTKAIANKAQATANSSYGAGPGRKFTISGYIQARFVDSESGSKTQFPSGAPASNSPYNGNYAQGGSRESINVRRARLKLSGQPTSNAKYAVQIDLSGIANPTIKAYDPGNAAPGNDEGTLSTSATAVALREANFTYSFDKGFLAAAAAPKSAYVGPLTQPAYDNTAYPEITVGQFANIYGYVLPESSSSVITLERPLAFNEGSNGIFTNQDYVRGGQASYTRGLFHVAAAVVDGNGYSSTNTSTAFEQIYTLNVTSANKWFNAGVSYDQGPLNTAISTPTTSTIYTLSQKQLVDFNAQVTLPSGPFLLGEYESGRYQQVSYFKSGASSVTTATDPGNDIEGYYVTGGYTFHPAGSHPFSLIYSYDALIRSEHATGTLYKSLGSLDDVNNGYGACYNLDKATRLRFWYTDPQSVAHIGVNPPKIGLFSTELQIKY